MPSLFQVGSYLVYFWSNENDEPVHVHISTGQPVRNAIKIWLTRVGGCIAANNDGQIPAQDLGEIMKVISAQFFWICAEWRKHFCDDNIRLLLSGNWIKPGVLHGAA